MSRSNCHEPWPTSPRRVAGRLTGSMIAVAVGILAAWMIGTVSAHAQQNTQNTQSSNGSTTYATTQRVYNVGILLVDSTNNGDGLGDENPDPYVFYVADQRVDLKPQGWEFANPLAPSTVTPTIKQRWDARMGGNSGYQIGQKITPNMAAYWEVSLTNTPISQLLQFDMLFITNHRKTSFYPADREKLRKLSDAGGVIWMEDCGAMQIGTATDPGTGQPEFGPFFLGGVQFEGNAFGNFVSSGPVIYKPQHPVLTTPYALTLSEIANLGDKNYGNFHIASFSASASANGADGQPNTIEQLPNPDVLVNVVGNSGAPKDPTTGQYLSYITVGHYGSGSVILTSGDSGCDINDYVGGSNTGSGGNSGAFSGTNFAAAHAEDLKFLYNIVSWGSSNSTYRRNDRRSAASYETMNAPLLNEFNFASLFRTSNPYSAGSDRITSKSAVLLYNGLVYASGVDASDSKLTLRAYDSQPFEDYDDNGNYDEGIPDVSLGLPYDEIWRWEGGKATGSGTDPFGNALYEDPSPPVIATVQSSAATQAPYLNAQIPLDEVFIAGPDGTLYIFSAFPGLTTGTISAAPGLIATVAPDASGNNTQTYNATATHGVSPAPVVYGSQVFQVEPDGQVRCISANPASVGQVMWTSFANGNPPYPIVPTATPTLGFSLVTGSTLAAFSEGNTNDLMLYVPAEVTNTTLGTSSGSPTGQILAYWVGTRNEVQHFTQNDGMGNGSFALMDTRVAGGVGKSGAAGYLNIAPGSGTVGPDFAGSPFTEPTVRVYSPTYNSTTGTIANTTVKTSVQYNYEHGIVSADYAAQFVTVGGYYTGQIEIVPTSGFGTSNPPGLASGSQSQIWASVDYDPMYIAGSTAYANPTMPANYNSVSTIGARNDPGLTIPNYHSRIGESGYGYPGGGLDTMTFSPEDLLVFSADQSPDSAAAASLTSVEAIHEELNATVYNWRFSLNDPGQATGMADNVNIVDVAPIYNFNLFDFTADGTLLTTAQPITQPEFISQVRTYGAPITTNSGMTYIVAGGVSTAPTSGNNSVNPYGLNQGPVTVVMAFTTNPSITLTLPIPFDPNSGVQISQVNALDNSTSVTASLNQLTLDATRGKITINNFGTTGGQLSASQSFVVQVTPVGQSTPVTFVIHPTPAEATAGQQVAGNINPEAGGFTPLQFYYVLPGAPLSAPTLVGGYLFFNVRIPVAGSSGSFQTAVVAVDANPSQNDPSVRTGFGEPVMNVSYPAVTGTPTHIHWIGRMADNSGATNTAVSAFAPPVGSEGTLAINTSIGTFAYQDSATLIADGARLIETEPDGTASWTLDTTQTKLVQGGDLPIFGPNGQVLNSSAGSSPSGRTTITSQTLSHPNLVHKIANTNYLIADTGNNRIVSVDRSGTIAWTLTTITDPYGLLASGDPITLSGPTDAQYYTVPYVLPDNSVGYSVHYLIADPGHYRIIEVADFFNSGGAAVAAPNAAATTAGQHVLVWTTRTLSAQGQRFAYTNIQRYLGTDASSPPAFANFPYIIATVSNSTVGGSTAIGGTNTTGGSLVSINYSPYATTIPVVQLSNGNTVPYTPWPVVASNPVASEPAGDGTVIAAANDLRQTNASQTTFGASGASVPTSTGATFTILRLQHPTYFTELSLPNINANPPTVRTVYLICDAGVVYAVEATVDTNGTAVRNVLWKFTQDDYNEMNLDRLYNAAKSGSYTIPSGLDPTQLPRFAPSSVKLLQNGDFLITNSYFGKCPLCKTGQFVGEVFQVSPTATPGSVNNGTATRPTTPFSLFTQASSTSTAEGGIWDGFAAPMLFATGTGLFYQQMGLTGNTNLLEQPLFSDRP